MAEPDQATDMERMTPLSVIPEPWVEPVDISNAVLPWPPTRVAASPGVSLPVDLGACLR